MEESISETEVDDAQVEAVPEEESLFDEDTAVVTIQVQHVAEPE